MTARRQPWGTFLLLLPFVWWCVQLPSELYYVGQLPGRVFAAIYGIPNLLAQWLIEKTGWWATQAHWVAAQDAVVSVVSTLVLARTVALASFWQESPMLRGATATLSVILPWYPMVDYLSRPDYYAVFTYSISFAYCLAVVGAFLFPVRRGVRVGLIGGAAGIGGAFVAWRAEDWDWLTSGSVAASFILLLYSGTRLRNNESVV